MAASEDRAALLKEARRDFARAGGQARSKAMTAQERSTAARKAAHARWKKAKSTRTR